MLVTFKHRIRATYFIQRPRFTRNEIAFARILLGHCQDVRPLPQLAQAVDDHDANQYQHETGIVIPGQRFPQYQYAQHNAEDNEQSAGRIGSGELRQPNFKVLLRAAGLRKVVRQSSSVSLRGMLRVALSLIYTVAVRQTVCSRTCMLPIVLSVIKSFVTCWLLHSECTPWKALAGWYHSRG